MSETAQDIAQNVSPYLTRMLEDFSPEEMGILESNLALNSEAWTIDRGHARKHGYLLVVDFRNPTKPIVQRIDNGIGLYLENPYRYYMMRYSRLTVEDQRKIMLLAAIPLETATDRQKEIFDTVAVTIDALFAKTFGEALRMQDLARIAAEETNRAASNDN